MAYEPRYIITHNILKYIGVVEAARSLIDTAAIVPSWEAQFRAEALNRTVHHGTRLEGNELSIEQVARVMGANEVLAERAASAANIIGRDRDVQEIINYRRVVEWIDQLGIKGRNQVFLSEKLLRDIHDLITYRILPEEHRGKYRNAQVVVKNSRTGEITFTPPTPDKVGYELQNFFEWVNSPGGKQHNAILRAGITHYELVRIHPFTDGNGRTARSMAMLLLYLEGYDMKRFFSLEEYFDANAADYYMALQSVGEGDAYDLTSWLEYFTQGLAIELDKVKLQVMKLSRDVSFRHKVGHQIALSERQIKILETLQKAGGTLMSRDLERVLPMVSVDTILRDLKDLMNKKLITKRGQTKGAYYTLAQ